MVRGFEEMKMSRRLIAGVGISILIFIIVLTLSFLRYRHLAQEGENIYKNNMIIDDAVKRIKFDISSLSDLMKIFILDEGYEINNTLVAGIKKYEQNILSDFNIILNRIKDDRNPVYVTYESFRKLHDVRSELIELKRSGKTSEILMKKKKSEKYLSIIKINLEKMSNFIVDRKNEAQKKARLKLKTMIKKSLVLVFPIFIIGLIFLFTIAKFASRSDVKYRALLDNLPIGVSITTPEGKVIGGNPAAQKLLGLKNEEDLIKYPVVEYYTNPERRKQLLEILQKDGKVENFKLRVKRKDGSLFWGLMNSVLVNFNKKEPVFINSFFDITKSIEAEDALEEMNGIIERSSTIAFLWKNKDNWPVEFVTNNVGRLLGYSRDEFMSQKVVYSNIIHPDDLERVGNEVSSNSKQKEISEFIHEPYRLIKKDGNIIWVRDITQIKRDLNGNITHYSGMIFDITQSVLMDRVVKESNERFMMLFNGAKDMIFIHRIYPNGKLGKFIEVNDFACERLGFTREELLEMSPDEITENDKKAVSATGLKEFLSKKFTVFELNLRTKDGREIPVEMNTTLIEIGEKPLAMSIARDMSSHKKMKAKLIKARNEAIRANKAKSVFLANMSHEIRTPMNGVLGMVQLALKTELTDTQKHYLNAIKISANSLMEIINNILDFSKIESGEINISKDIFNIKTTIDNSLHAFTATKKNKKIDIIKNMDDDIPEYLIGDPVRLRQVIINLIGNSVKFTEKGKVELNLIMISKNDKEVAVQFEVKDTGIGIPLEKQRTIFEPFSQVENTFSRNYKGTGLGLSITKSLISLMGGELLLDSEEGVGSNFHFILNFEISDKKPLDLQEEEVLELKSEKKEEKDVNILLVEDNLINQEIAKELLKARGYTVTIAETGSEAVENVKNTDFDIILMDIQMPDMDGMEATGHIRNFESESGKYTPIIAMTAYAREEEKTQFLKTGMDDYVSKPFKREDLYRKIEALLKKHIK